MGQPRDIRESRGLKDFELSGTNRFPSCAGMAGRRAARGVSSALTGSCTRGVHDKNSIIGIAGIPPGAEEQSRALKRVRYA